MTISTAILLFAFALFDGGGGASLSRPAVADVPALISFSDDFNRANGSPGANWTSDNGTWAISGNQLIQSAGDTVGAIRCMGRLFHPDFQAVKVTFAGTSTEYRTVLFRLNVGSTEGYGVAFDDGGNVITWYDLQNNFGAGDVQSTNLTVTSSQTWGLTLTNTGNNVELRGWLNPTGDPLNATNWNGAGATFTLTANPVTAQDYGNMVGLSGYNPSGGTYGFDNFTAYGFTNISGVITGSQFVDFENTNHNTVVTSRVLTNSTRGSTAGGWQTVQTVDLTPGSTPNMIISSNAAMSFPSTVSVGGVGYTGGGTNGMRVTNNTYAASKLLFSGNGFPVSIGYSFRWNGPNVDFGPRDAVGLRSDPSGNYQFVQHYDNNVQPIVHAHWQPGGTGVGNNINFDRNKEYWLTTRHVLGGQTMRLLIYDPSLNYAYVGQSTGDVSSGTVECTALLFGLCNYPVGMTQTFDYDNLIVNTNGVFPLIP